MWKQTTIRLKAGGSLRIMGVQWIALTEAPVKLFHTFAKEINMVKKAAMFLLPAILGLSISIMALLLSQVASVQASPGIYYVAPGAGCGGSVPNCYASVQTAVDAASPGDEIRVAAGVYSDVHVRPRSDITTTGVVTQSVYLTKSLTIRGGYNSDFSAWDPETYATTLDAQGQGRVLYITGDISPTIEGLGITGGDDTGMDGYGYAGIHDVGGGVYVLTATVTLKNNMIFSNTSSYNGGGLFLGESTGVLHGNRILNNHAKSGAGVFLYEGAPTLDSNTVLSNTSTNLGGGIYMFASDALLKGNTISGNSASTIGGGLDVASCSPTLSGNVLSGNSARKGGGIYLWYSRSVLTNNVIMDNLASVDGEGSGLWIGGSEPLLLQTTLARNTGGDGSGVMVTDAGSTPTTLVMTNTLVADHSIGISVTAGSKVDMDGVLWFNTPVKVSHSGATVNVQHQYQGDPAFGADGYHLTAGSAAIDKGVPAGVLTDLDGQARFGSLPDLGADEYWPAGYPRYLYLPLSLKNTASLH